MLFGKQSHDHASPFHTSEASPWIILQILLTITDWMAGEIITRAALLCTECIETVRPTKSLFLSRMVPIHPVVAYERVDNVDLSACPRR